MKVHVSVLLCMSSCLLSSAASIGAASSKDVDAVVCSNACETTWRKILDLVLPFSAKKDYSIDQNIQTSKNIVSNNYPHFDPKDKIAVLREIQNILSSDQIVEITKILSDEIAKEPAILLEDTSIRKEVVVVDETEPETIEDLTPGTTISVKEDCKPGMELESHQKIRLYEAPPALSPPIWVDITAAYRVSNPLTINPKRYDRYDRYATSIGHEVFRIPMF